MSELKNKLLNSIIKKISTLTFILFFTANCGNGQTYSSGELLRGDLRLMFYNCENLFDTDDDPLKRDNEFLPDGDRNWSKYRYWKKLSNIYKVIIAVGGWNPPDIIGFCEVENRKVLNDLVYNTPLSRINYEIVHYESPDKRGIDVALLYRPDKVELLSSQPIQINFPNNPNYKTRDILYVKTKLKNGDTLHVFVNHWPSRWRGQLESEPSRIFAATVLREKVDSILNASKNANIVITGDFNDEPEDKSLKDHLNAKLVYEKYESSELYNLSYYLEHEKQLGSYKYRSEWSIIDQIIVSGAMLNESSKLKTSLQHVAVFNAGFLLEKDESYLGIKPFRTYIGFSFNNGFSDHLPVYLDINFKN